MKIFPAKKFILKSGLTVWLRSPEVEDALVMLDYLKLLFQESWENLNYSRDYGTKVSLEVEKEIIAKKTKHPRDFFLSAFLENKIIGSFNLNVLPGELVSHVGQMGLGVLKEFQNMGLGKILMQEGMKEAQKNNVWNFQLQVRVLNEPAIKLYENLGFERIGKLKKIAKVGEKYVDEYLYQLVS